MSPRRAPGRLIVLEGLDGAGTTTQVARLAEALRAAGHPVRTTGEPSQGPVGVLLRQALTGRVGLPDGGRLGPETLALLFAADRTDHLQAELLPALASGELVLCDRYVLSSLAYQGTELPMAWVEALNARARPADLTLFLEVGSATAGRRRAGRGAARELYEEDGHQRRIARSYEQAIRLRGERERLVRIDGEAPVEEVTRQALAALRPLLRRRPATRAG